MSLRGARLLVTGATGGLGPSIVEAALAVGAEVMAVARRRTGLDELRAGLGHHDRLAVAEGDVTDPAGVEALFDAMARKGPIDGVVQVAGAFRWGPLAQLADEDLTRLVQANVLANALVLRAAMRRMVPAGAGSVVLIAADRALVPAADFAMYGAAKAAVVHLAQAAAAEGQPHGVRVNAVLPGTMDTAGNREAMPEADRSRWVKPTDVARAVLWLLDPESGAVAGALVRLPAGEASA